MSTVPMLEHNINAMKETKQTPSFAQVLICFIEALEEIKELRAALEREVRRKK